jgi:hypothetical protein
MTAPDHAALVLAQAGPLARAYGLRRGDLLVALNGRAIAGDPRAVLAGIKRGDAGPSLLRLRRGGDDWDLIADPRQLGRWRAGRTDRAPGQLPARRGLRNWDVMVTPAGVYDVQMQAPRLLAFLVPVYLMQMRLWGPLAIWAAVLLIGLMPGLVWAGIVQVVMAVYIWRAGPMLVRADRQAQGLRLWRVMAAPQEGALHRQLAQMMPDWRFIHLQDRD